MMFSKGLAVAVILLLIGVNIVPSSAVQELIEKPSRISFDGNTLYVGGNGPNNYTSIQAAINDALDGDTVFIYSWTYYEYEIVVEKSISIIGEDKNTTIIDGDDNGRYIIKLGKNDIIFRDLTVSTPKSDGLGIGIVLSYGASNCTIDNCNILISETGLYFGDNCNNNVISQCIIKYF